MTLEFRVQIFSVKLSLFMYDYARRGSAWYDSISVPVTRRDLRLPVSIPKALSPSLALSLSLPARRLIELPRECTALSRRERIEHYFSRGWSPPGKLFGRFRAAKNILRDTPRVGQREGCLMRRWCDEKIPGDVRKRLLCSPIRFDVYNRVCIVVRATWNWLQ